MKKILSTIILTIAICLAFGQGSYEAFRFSQIDYQGTARFLGAGGAFSATGGEFSALSINPAAIGLFKRSEVTFTPLALSFSNNTTLGSNGTLTGSHSPKYTVPECGLVIATPINNSSWKTWQFGFGYNRIMDYNNSFRAATSGTISMIDPILDRANGTPFTNLQGDAYLAWETWLIDTIPGTTNQYFSPLSGEWLDQNAIITTSGAMDEMSFTFGGNYNDQLYIGGSIGVPVLDYTEKTSYKESPTYDNNIQGCTSYTVQTIQKNSGAGINAKLGIIYQPVNFLRLGASLQTPSYFFRIKDTYNRYMASQWVIGSDASDEYINYNRFGLSTPLRFNLASSFIIKQRAFIAVEYDFIDYRMSRLIASNNDINDNNWLYFDEANQDVVNTFAACHTIKIGGEIALNPKFLVRLGYNYRTSPYKLVDNEYNASAHTASVGIGYRSKYFFCNLAYALRFSSDNYTLYQGSYPYMIKNETHRVAATIGCKF
ncbi:MAG: hypothetical protein MJZ39_01975 [Bacteroidales bacterium]|nr:hypothetical protein [Bacteroidales bacterium]